MGSVKVTVRVRVRPSSSLCGIFKIGCSLGEARTVGELVKRSVGLGFGLSNACQLELHSEDS